MKRLLGFLSNKIERSQKHPGLKLIGFETCPRCVGSGYSDMATECTPCNGRGKVQLHEVERDLELDERWEHG